MPAKRGKKNAQFGLGGKIGAEWRGYGKKTPLKTLQNQCGSGLAREYGVSVAENID